MARYYLHLHECGTVYEDMEGIELSDPDAAAVTAVYAARELMAAEVQAGKLCLSCFIAVHDETGRQIVKVPFAEAVDLTGL
jgi:hypothetical protein